MIEEHRLPNGLRLLVEPTDWLQGVTAGVYIATGSADEPAGLEGIAHVLEHVVFKGTGAHSGREIGAAIEAFGGELNAYTSKEYTCIWGRALPEGLSTLVQLLGELFLSPALRARELELERRVILEEHATWLDSPEDRVSDLLETQIFGDHPLAHTVLGRPGSLRAITIQDLRRFHAETWRPERAVLAVSGPVDPGDVRTCAERWFREARTGPQDTPKRPAPQADPEPEPEKLRLSQVHVAIGGPARALGDPLLPAQELLIDELGGGPNSRLFQRLREQDALSYGVYAFQSAYRQGGMWGVYADLSRGAWQDGVRAIVQEMEALRSTRYTATHLGRLRQSARGEFLLALDAPFARLERAAVSGLLLGHVEQPEVTAARISGVKAQELHLLAREFFSAGPLSIAVIDDTGAVRCGGLRDVAGDVLDGLEDQR